MPVAKRIALLTLFFFLYGLYPWISHVFIRKLKRDLVQDGTFWNSQIGIVSTIVPFCLFIYLLSGLFSVRLVALLFVVAQLGVVIFGCGDFSAQRTTDGLPRRVPQVFAA